MKVDLSCNSSNNSLTSAGAEGHALMQLYKPELFCFDTVFSDWYTHYS